jgi:hypothetical protein
MVEIKAFFFFFYSFVKIIQNNHPISMADLDFS